jgi:hypothetical protein
MPTIDALPDDLQGVVKTFTITYPAVAETLNGAPPNLPTSFPGTPQFNHTAVSGDLPTISPAPLNVPKYHALIMLAGDNTSGMDRTIACEVYKNSVLVSGSEPLTSTSTSEYWTLNAFVPSVVSGDVVEVFAMASGGGVTWDYQAYAVTVDEVQLAPPDRLLARVSYALIAHPVLALGSPLVISSPTTANTGPFHIQHLGLMGAEISVDTDLTSQVQRSSMGAGWCHYGHQAHTALVIVSRTSRPTYLQNMVPSAITFTLTDITV